MSTLYWSLRETARWLKNVWHWPESGTVPPPDVHFGCGGIRNKENIEEWWVILVTSHAVLTWIWHITTQVRSTECVGLCQHLCLVVRVDLMFVTAGNETDRAHKIWQEGLLVWNTFLQAMLVFDTMTGGIKEFEIMVAKFVSAVSSSTHFSISNRIGGNDAQCASSLIRLSITITKTPFFPHIMLWHWKSIFQVPF